MLIRLDGADAALKALRRMEPETAREVGREVSSIGRGLAAAVRSTVPGEPPVSGWRATSGVNGGFGGRGWPGWTRVQTSSMRRGMSVRVKNTSPDGNIIAAMAEFLGHGTRVSDPVKGARLSRMAKSRMGAVVPSGRRNGRSVYRAIAEQYPQIYDDLTRAAERAAAAVNRLMP